MSIVQAIVTLVKDKNHVLQTKSCFGSLVTSSRDTPGTGALNFSFVKPLDNVHSGVLAGRGSRAQIVKTGVN